MRKHTSYILVLLLLSMAMPTHAADNFDSYAKVKVKPGDGVISLLNRYKLGSYNCNATAFYEINKMNKNAVLRADKAYNLPIQIFNYNGTSIRSTIGNNDWDLAIAIQDYNKWLKGASLKSRYYTDDKKLYVPHHLLACATPTAASVAVESISYVNSSLFGANYKAEKRSNVLSNKVYYVISGHGGPDPGAMKKKGSAMLCEDEYAYDVSLRLARNLMQHGATVHMIIQDKNDGIREGQILNCDKDERTKSGQVLPLNQTARLRQRVNEVNSTYKREKSKGKKEHAVIAIHVDSRSVNTRQDVFFYYSPGSSKGRRLALDLQDTFKEKYRIHRSSGTYSGTVSGRGLYVLRKTNPPAVYVELANIQNSNDQKRIMPSSNRDALAKWLFEGLTDQKY